MNSKRLKIAFISSGNSVHVKKLANGLVENGHLITLFTLPNHRKLINEFRPEVNVVYLPFGGKKGYYLNVYALRKFLKKEKFDIINCHFISGYGTLTRLADVHPIVTSVFGSDVYDYPYKSKNNMKRIIKNLDTASVITSTSQVMADKVREYYHTEKPIYVTHFGIDTKIFKPLENKRNEDLPKQEFIFGVIKKMEDIYGIEILIRAFKLLLDHKKKEFNYKLFIYGRGSKEEAYKKLVENLGISKNVDFKGYIQNDLVPQAMSQMDVICLPSHKESFGVAAVEAMACGKPLIVSDTDGFIEVVEDNVSGFIIPRGDIQALSSTMLRVSNMETEELNKIGEQGSLRAKKMFDFEINMQTYIEAISQAVDKEM